MISCSCLPVCAVTCLSSLREPAAGTSTSVGMMAYSCNDIETISVCAHLQVCDYLCICKSSFTLSLAIFCFCLQTFKSTTLGKIKMNINYLHAHVPKMYNLCKFTAFSSLFQLLSSACTHCHFKSVTSSKCPTCRWHFPSIFPGEWVLDASGTFLHWPPTL